VGFKIRKKEYDSLTVLMMRDEDYLLDFSKTYSNSKDVKYE
jgi:hypothetical protein